MDAPIEVTAQLFRSIHDLSGLPYGLTIPLTAFALRAVVTLPLSIYSQKKLNRRIELRPLYYHWGELIGSQVLELERAPKGATDKATLRNIATRVQRIVRDTPFKVNMLRYLRG